MIFSENRISQKHLEELNSLLAERDKEILHSLEKCRYMTSQHIRRLHFDEHISHVAAIRAANRGLVKLQGYGLIAALHRRIGGIKGGSDSNVCFLSEAGNRLLHMGSQDKRPRKRLFEPSRTFLKHTLGITEIYVRITEICREHAMQQIKTELEPDCWRGYTDSDGKRAVLKPDILTVIADWEYEYSYFFEIDLDTESLPAVLEKGRRYACYYRASNAGKKEPEFPLVVWIVPNHNRKESLRRHIAGCHELRPKHIFLVIVQDEFEMLLRREV